MDPCLNPIFLRLIYISKVILNVIRFVVPILLIVKLVLDMYKQIINPTKDDGKKIIKNRIIAAVIVFIIPTLVNLFLNLLSDASNTNYSGFSQCIEFANLDYIKVLEEKRNEEEMQLYLSEQEKNLSSYEKIVAATRALVKSMNESAKVGTPADKSNVIKCGTGSSYNTQLFNTVRTAGYKTREGVAAAAIYLSSHIDVHIPYFWSGGHFHTYSGYNDSGENFIGVPDKWGCDVKMAFGGTSKQPNGVAFPFGMDCSGFVAWAIFNGGYYTGNSKQEVRVSTDSTPPTTIGGIKVSSVKVGNAKGKIKPGDVAFKAGHVGMILEVTDDYFMVAEEQNAANGLVVTKRHYSGFTDIILMDNFYENYEKTSPLWNGFK